MRNFWQKRDTSFTVPHTMEQTWSNHHFSYFTVSEIVIHTNELTLRTLPEPYCLPFCIRFTKHVMFTLLLWQELHVYPLWKMSTHKKLQIFKRFFALANWIHISSQLLISKIDFLCLIFTGNAPSIFCPFFINVSLFMQRITIYSTALYITYNISLQLSSLEW